MTQLGNPSGLGILFGTTDPSTGAGVEAPVGFQYRNTVNGNVWDKTTALDTGWTPAGSGGGGGGGTITFPAINETTDEDVTKAGNVLAGASATSGTLSVMFFTITGVVGIFQAGETVPVPGLGTFSLLASGVYEYIPPANFNGTGPTVTIQITNGSDTKISTWDIEIGEVNDAPSASDAYALSFSGEDVEIDLSEFVTDPDTGAVITLTQLDGVAVVLNTPVAITGGTYTWTGGTTVLVNPDSAEVDPLAFTYTVSDGTLTDTASVTVQVGVTNTPMLSPISPILGNPLDVAVVNFAKTVRAKYGPLDENGVNVTVPPYSAGQGHFVLTDREPWLYDRATTLYLVAKRTNNATILAEAMALARTYMAGVILTGGRATFNIIGTTGGDPQDVKYLYGIVAYWYEQETLAAGGTALEAQVYRTKAEGLYRQTLVSWGLYDGGTAELWTERNAWCAITNCLAWYWISGDAVALADAAIFVEDVLLLSATSDAPLHSKDKHESDGDPTPIISPWMSGLLAEAMLQYHRTTDSVGLSKSIPAWLSDYGDWLIANAFYTATGAEEPEYAGIAGMRIPAYLAGTGVQFPEGESADVEHCIDVAELMRKVKWAKEELSLSTVAVDTLITELETAGEVNLLYWTRTTVGYPHYRVNPPRKFGWWFRCRYSAVHSVGIVPFPPSLTTAPVVTGSTQQGSLLSCSTGVWAGTPAPTYTYQWRRDAVNIGAATADTYTTQAADVDTAVDCVVTATNTGGSASSDSNDINVVAAGSPEITVQPTNEQALVGATAIFSLTATGTPAPTYQWQRNHLSGGWINVSEGTGGTTDTFTTETLDALDDGDLFRCVVTNTGGSVTSDIVALTMVVQQEAVSFADSTDFGTLSFAFGSAGFVEWTTAGWVYLDNAVNNSSAFVVEGIAGRMALLQFNNSGPVFGIGDSNTGTIGGAFDVAPPADTWVFMVFRGVTAHPGTFTAYWYQEDGTLGGSASRANGIEDSVAPQALHLNGGGITTGLSMRAQYVRAYGRRLSDGEIATEYSNTNMSTDGLLYYNVFEDNGGGGVAVRDASGNNRVFTLTGATLSVLGPVAPSV
jgi:hypothetical protein